MLNEKPDYFKRHIWLFFILVFILSTRLLMAYVGPPLPPPPSSGSSSSTGISASPNPTLTVIDNINSIIMSDIPIFRIFILSSNNQVVSNLTLNQNQLPKTLNHTSSQSTVVNFVCSFKTGNVMHDYQYDVVGLGLGLSCGKNYTVSVGRIEVIYGNTSIGTNITTSIAKNTSSNSILNTSATNKSLNLNKTSIRAYNVSKQKSNQSFLCSTLPDIRSRISCRISLKFENELNYLPEECRDLNSTAQTNCIGLYAKIDPCFSYQFDADRLACTRKILGLQSISVRQQVYACNGYMTCLSRLTQNIYALTKFRFYNLEYKAQEMLDYGVNKTMIVNVIVKLEQQKITFNNANTIEQKIQIVNNVSAIWKEFASSITSTS